ncbi:MAG TPA: M23 family metallopeptidase [Longimicrobiales bacterium]|nr:M23 family metallopeptidase [Longimicrobiales bacterium]
MSRPRRNALRTAAAACAAAALAACQGEPPDVGRLAGIWVPPAENVRIYALRSGQTFGALLSDALSANEQANLLMAFREHASPRRMRQGTEITLRYLRDDDELRGVDVALTPDETIRLTRAPLGWRSERIETPVYVDTIYASGEIESVLWSAVVDNSALDELTFEDRNRLIDHLDQVFQWQVDFSRQIRQGDTYRFVFEREVRPDGSMRAGKLLAAELVNGGTAYHAIWFDPNGDGRGSYYDVDGQSVRRAFLLKPLAYRRISSRFTNGRFHPILKTWRAHRGVDYAADAGTEIMATADGVVIYRGYDSSYGNSIQIRHPNGFVTRYAHMRAFATSVVVGTRVHQGDVIGYVGMTGLATGPHLHYEMMRNGRYLDPLSVDLPAGDPVPSEDLERWDREKSVRMALLESIPAAGPVRTVLAEGPPAPLTDGGAPPAGGGLQ